MLFSAKAEYACVAMLELAAHYADPRPVQLGLIAEKHGISDRFLVQILLDLKRAGLVESVRGAAGGYTLSRRPEEISLYDVLRVVDPPPPPRPTSRRNKTGPQPTAYVRAVRSVWDRVLAAQHAVLRDTTLADIVAQSEGLQYVI